MFGISRALATATTIDGAAAEILDRLISQTGLGPDLDRLRVRHLGRSTLVADSRPRRDREPRTEETDASLVGERNALGARPDARRRAG